MGEKIFHRTMVMLGEKVMVENEELNLPHEEDADHLYEPAEEGETSNSDEYESTEEKRKLS